MAPYARSLSRTRYELMIRQALEIFNVGILAQNQAIAWERKKTIPLLTYNDLLLSRKREVAYMRYRIFRDLRRLGFSYPTIAKVSGYDHSTVIYGVKRIEGLEPLGLDVAALKWTPILATAPGLVADANLADLAA